MNLLAICLITLVAAMPVPENGRDGWFPQFSPDGQFVCSGSATIWVSYGDGSMTNQTQNPGLRCHWLDSTTIVYPGPGTVPKQFTPHLLKFPFTGAGVQALAMPANLVAGGGGIWAAWIAAGDFATVLSDGRRFPNRGNPNISPTGVVVFNAYSTGDKIFRVDAKGEQLVDSFTYCTDPYILGDNIVWSRFTPTRRTFGMIWGTGKILDLSAKATTGHEYQPMLANIPGKGIFIANYNATCLYGRMWGSQTVILLHQGDSHNPHIAWDDRAKVLRSAFSNAQGVFGMTATPLLDLID
jgi:hypothetical protein